MSTHSWRTEIDLPKNQVWELLSEHYADIYKMHPGVRISNQVEGTPSLGLGQERVCHMYDGNRAQERITAHEEGKLLAIELVDSTLPMQKFSADFKLTEIAQGRTAVDMSVEVKGKGFLTVAFASHGAKNRTADYEGLKGP